MQAINLLKNYPVAFANMLGFVDMVDLHNKWMRSMIVEESDKTLMAHRESFKTTCVSIAIAILMILFPNKKILFMRKTDDDVKEVIRQVSRILLDERTIYIVRCIYGEVVFGFTSLSAKEINTTLATNIKSASQLLGIGIGSSLTGKHFDIIFTDDIVNIQDRISRAERDRTKLIYQELQNIKNRGGRIFNTGTPWHKDDCFTLMPEADKYDCYMTGLMTKEQIQDKRDKLTPSLFSANYELKHIAGEDIIFISPVINGESSACLNGIAHVDSAFYGEDYTAFTIMQKHEGKYYVFGKMWRKHVEDCYNEILKYYQRFLCSKLYTEDNADKGMVAKELRRLGIRTVTYHESTNKHIKIVTYLKAIWKDVVFIEGTDEEYINQICDYTENAEHDDSCDSCACLARILYKKKSIDNQGYKSIYM